MVGDFTVQWCELGIANITGVVAAWVASTLVHCTTSTLYIVLPQHCTLLSYPLHTSTPPFHYHPN